MKKTLSVREIALLGLLLVAVVYIFVFHLPVKNETAELNNQIADLQTQIETNETLLITMNTMKKDVDAASQDSSIRPLPLYNNSNNIITELNTILNNASTERYDIDFSNESENENVICREIRINFVADSYESATEKLCAIRDSENCYVITDLNIVESDVSQETGLAKYSVSVNIYAYEYKA